MASGPHHLVLRDPAAAAGTLQLGLHHEQQHQELLLTDIRHALSQNPLLPAYAPVPAAGASSPGSAAPLRWARWGGGPVQVGHDAAGATGFAFDNESPRHTGWLARAGDGSAREGYTQFTLHGEQPLDAAAPVCHLSGYEAAAFAAWAGARLPTEFEWEHGASAQAAPVRQLHGEVWQWTASAYAPYPGFRPLAGPAAEYNGKFMVNQLVLRGSSFATPDGQARHSYRNFFPAAARWQFSGLRLARDAG